MLQATADNSPLGPTTRCAHCRMRERITLGRNVQNVIAEPGWCSRVRRSSLAVDAYMDLTFHTGLLGSSLSNRECTETAALGYSVSTEGRAMTTQMLAVDSIPRREPSIGLHRGGLALRRGVPHQPRVEGFGGEHRQDHDAAKGERADPGLDRDHRAEGDEGTEQRLHEDVDHRPAPDK